METAPLPLDAILDAYCNGYFAMGGSGHEGLQWYSPDIRAIMPIRGLRVSRKLRRLALGHPYDIHIDTAFDRVIAGCSEGRSDQWITQDIQILFNALHKAGYAHSVECWRGNDLVGGVYGLALGSAFCAESMFSRESNASKIALAHLCARLDRGGFTLMDCQILNDHTQRLGAIEIPRGVYLDRLRAAIRIPADFLLQKGGFADEKSLLQDYLG